MTRIKRINADFYHAFGAMVIRSATNYTNFPELNIHFVPINALSRKRSLCLNPRKSVFIRVIRSPIVVAFSKRGEASKSAKRENVVIVVPSW
jgi:hypothetical protein